jgi:tetratricopeptide (TPR) repeat protein
MTDPVQPLRTDALNAKEITDAVWLAARIASAGPAGSQAHLASGQPLSEPESRPPEPPPVPALPVEEEATQQPGSAGQRRLEPPAEPSAGQPGQGVAPARSWPVLPGLPRGLVKALRPLNRLVRSMRQWELNEEDTAVAAAESGLWFPVQRRAYEHPYEVVLVIDSGMSMCMWERTADAFQKLLTRQGAFTDVKSVSVNTDDKVVTAVETMPGVTRSPAQLADPTGRRIILVLTDGVGPAWRTGSMRHLMLSWARTCHVALVQVLPPERWSWVGMHVEPRTVQGMSGAVIPVLALDRRFLHRWAELVAGAHGVRLPVLAPPSEEDTDDREPPALVPESERLYLFQATATPEAVRLAGLLAAAPLTLRVMQAVHGTFMPESEQWHLAEVLLSGLLRRTSAAQHDGPPLVEYEFVPGFRRILLSMVTREETAHVLRVVEDVLGPEERTVANLRQVLAAPDEVAVPAATARNAPVLAALREVFAALSGPYARRATLLEEGLTAQAGYHRENGGTEFGSVEPRDGGELGASPGRPATGQPTRRTSSVLSTGPELSDEPRRPERQPSIWGNIPLRNVNFIGRAELLARVFQEISKSTATALTPGALFGMAGVGKSQVAVEYIYRHATEYDLVWWIPSENTTEIQSALVRLAVRLGLPVEHSVDTAVPAILDRLRVSAGDLRWLLVFDNADRPEDVRTFLPRGGNGHIIVTSRNPQWAAVARPLAVEVFQRAESCELLQRRNPDLTYKDADRVATVLGDLPLAIEQAAAWRAETGMSTDEYLKLFEDKRTELLESRITVDYDVSVEAAWNLSLDSLRANSSGALELLEVCAFLSPEPISRKIFTSVRNIPVSPELERILANPIELGRAVREINRYSLARIDHPNDTLQLHRLVQLVLRNKLEPDDQDRVRHVAQLLLAHQDPGNPDDVESWPRYGELLPHVRAAELRASTDQWARRLVINTIHYLFAFGDMPGGLDMARDCASFWTKRLGEKHPDTLIASRWLGRLLRAVGRFKEGREVAERTLELMRRTLGHTHEETLLTMHGVASDLRAKGDFHAARKMNESAYRSAVERFGENDPDTLGAANNYALSLRLAGEFGEARRLDEDTLRRKRSELGDNHRHTLLTMDNWAVDLRETGDYLRARVEQDDVVHRMRAQFGERHPMTLASIKNLATAYRRARGNLDKKSLSLALEATQGLVSRYGDSHPEAMSAVLDLSVGHRQDGNLPEARKVGERAKGLYERTWGLRHPFSVAAATNLAVTLRLLERFDQARALNEKAAADMREVLGADHPFTLVCATNYASDLAASGEHEAACALDQETCDRSVTVLGANHPATLALRVNLALDLRNLGRVDEADVMQIDAIQGLRQVLGSDHPATAAAQFNHRADCDIDTMQI